MDKLQSLRNRLGKPLIVRSGYRSPSHNRAVGGAPASKHMLGTAFDIAMSNHDPVTFAEAARAVGFLGFGTYPRSGFMHIDLGPARSWGEPFPRRATPFVPETQPAREVLADSRTLKGGGAAGIATVGAAGVEVAQDVLAETQSAILPLVPYLDTLRWVFIAVALIGIASRSTPGSMTGSGASADGLDHRPPRQRPGAQSAGPAAGRPHHRPVPAEPAPRR
jgi:hypothetical protein